MRMTKEHYSEMKRRIEVSLEVSNAYKELEFNEVLDKIRKSSPSVVSNINSYCRWSLFSISRIYSSMGDRFYNYLDDDHIDTALRRVVRELLKEGDNNEL